MKHKILLALGLRKPTLKELQKTVFKYEPKIAKIIPIGFINSIEKVY